MLIKKRKRRKLKKKKVSILICQEFKKVHRRKAAL